MTDKVYTWDKRKPVEFFPGTAYGPHKVYFFRKSFDDCTGNTMISLAHSMIETSEKMYAVPFTPLAQQLLKTISVESVEDPLLKAIFGFKCQIDQKSIVDYYEKFASMDEDNYMPFVDLCVVLGEENRAQKFAERVGKKFEILQILDQSQGQLQSEVLGMNAVQMWLEKAPRNLAAARLTSIIHRCAEGANGESELRSLAELWGEGFYWDAFCLVSILMPNDAVISFMKENIPRFLKEHEGGFLAGVLKWVFTNSLNTAQTKQEGPIAMAFENEYLKHLDALSLYRIVKIDIFRNEKNVSSDIDKLGVRAKCSEALRFVLLTAIAQLGPVMANILASDAVAFIKTLGIESDYFPNAERVLFESFVSMIVDVYSVVFHVLLPQVASSSTISFEAGKSDGFTNIVFAKWRKEHAEVWCDSGYWARSSFVQTLHYLFNYLMVLEKNLNETTKMKGKILKLALRLCWLFASNEFNPAKCGSRPFIQVAMELDFSDEEAQTIATAFALKGSSEAYVCSSTHLTGDDFISATMLKSVVQPLVNSAVPRMSTHAVIEHDEKDLEKTVQMSEVVVTKGEKEQQVVQPSPVQLAVASETNSLQNVHRVGTVTAQKIGQAVLIVSEDSVHGSLNGNMETKWEAPREASQLVATDVGDVSRESATEAAEGSISPASETGKQEERFGKDDSFASKTTYWNKVQQERTMETSFEVGSVNTTLNTTVDAAEPTSHSQPTHIAPQPVVVTPVVPIVSVVAPNALDNLLNTCDMNGGGDAPSVVPVGQPTQSNVTSRASSVSAAAAGDDSRSSHSISSTAAVTAATTPVQQQHPAFGASSTSTSTSSATVAAATPPVQRYHAFGPAAHAASTTSSASTQKFSIGGFEQTTGECGFGNFGANVFGSMGGRGGGRGGVNAGNNFGGGNRGSFGGGHGGGSGYRGGSGNFRGGDGGRGRGGNFSQRGNFNSNN